MQSYVIHLECSALTVNLKQPRITWKVSLSEGLSTSAWLRNISLRACLHFIKAERLIPPRVAPLPSRRILTCIRVENSSWDQASQWPICIHFPLLLTASTMWLAVSSLWCLGILLWWTVTWNCKLKQNFVLLNCLFSGCFITATQMKVEHDLSYLFTSIV